MAFTFDELTALILSASSWRAGDARSDVTMLEAALMRDALPTPLERVTASRETYAMRTHGTTWGALTAA